MQSETQTKSFLRWLFGATQHLAALDLSVGRHGWVTKRERSRGRAPGKC